MGLGKAIMPVTIFLLAEPTTVSPTPEPTTVTPTPGEAQALSENLTVFKLRLPL